MPDLLARVRKELDARIRELRPVVREFERLQRATTALARGAARSVPGIGSRAGAPERRGAETGRPAPAPKAKPAASKVTPAARKPSRARGAAPRRKSAPRGQTQAKVLAALAGAPGSSAAAVAKASGVSSNVAAATLSRLAKQGRVQRLDSGGYAVVEAASAQPRRGPIATAEEPPEPTSGEQPPSPGTA